MTVFFRPYNSLSVRPTPRSSADEELAAFLEEKTGIKAQIDPSVDYEEWTEPACMLRALIHEGVEIKILPLKRLQEAMEQPLVEIPGQDCPKMLMGRLQEQDERDLVNTDFVWPPAYDSLADHYGSLESFTRFAGRKVQLADMPGEPYPGGIRFPAKTPDAKTLKAAIDSLDLDQVIVKHVWPPKSFPLVALEGTREEKMRSFWDKYEWHAIKHEGAKAALLVQEQVEMTHETRVFVVNGKPVCAAACIEADTPLVNEGGEKFPGRFEIARNGGVHIFDQEVRDMIWAFVHEVTREISAETDSLRNYVIDVALGSTEEGLGKPLVIELNQIASSGLYGQDVSRLVPAFLEVAKTLDVQPTSEALREILGRAPAALDDDELLSVDDFDDEPLELNYDAF